MELIGDAAAGLVRLGAAVVLLLAALSLGLVLTDALLARRRAVATLWLLTVVFHALLWTHLFTLPATLLTLGGASLLLRARAGRAWRRAAAFVKRLGRRGAPSPWAVVAGGSILLIGLRALFLPPVGWDSLTYHLVKAALWVEDGRPIEFVTPGGWGCVLRFPGGGEAVWAWAMLPFHSDLLVGMADVFIFCLLGIAVYALGRELGLGSRSAALGAAFVVAMPAVWLAAGSNYVDNLAAFWSVAAVAFVLRYQRRGDPGWATLAGMAFGLAAGAKMHVLPVAGVLAAGHLLRRAWGGARTRAGLATALLPVAAGLAVCAPWYVSNWLETGHPLSPIPVRVGGLVLGESAVFDWYLAQPVGHAFDPNDEWTAIQRLFNTPLAPSLGPAAAVPLLLLPLALLKVWRRRRGAAVVIVLLVAHSASVYMSPTFAVTRLGWAANNGRYFLLTVILAVQLGFLVLPGAPYKMLLALAAGYNVWVHAALHWTSTEVALVFGHLALASLGVWIVARARVPLVRKAALAAALGAAFLGEASLWRDAVRVELFTQATRQHDIPRYWVPGVPLVSGRAPLRLAFTTGPFQRADNWLLYGFLGPRLQNRPLYVPISASGRIVEHTTPEYWTSASADAWVERIGARRVDAVVALQPPGPELVWMEARPQRFVRRAGDGESWGVYEVVKTAAPAVSY